MFDVEGGFKREAWEAFRELMDKVIDQNDGGTYQISIRWIPDEKED